MSQLKLRVAVTHHPRSQSTPATIPAGQVVQLVRKVTATLFTVTLKDPQDTFPVLASEVEETHPA